MGGSEPKHMDKGRNKSDEGLTPLGDPSHDDVLELTPQLAQATLEARQSQSLGRNVQQPQVVLLQLFVHVCLL